MTDPCVAVVLAGGAGRRMGGGKPLRTWGETSLLTRALILARGYGDEIAVAVRDADQIGGEVGVPLLFDRPDVPGPLAGLASALAFARSRGATWVQLLACDMPRLPDDLTLRLAAALRSNAKVALPASNDHLHPICGLWSTTVEPRLADYLAQGRSSLRGLAAVSGEVVVDWGTVQPDPFVNLNTLAELHAQQPMRRQA
ncbi:molybdenum cofactor guanylyltransferase [Caulobacter sp.]|uniref:molybdenum cofactor guanylyltransferase n=1 Tax=Caulobacter sp. TaxID=78 RepID=UPI003BB0E9E9